MWFLVALAVGTKAVAVEPGTLRVLTEAVMDLEHQIADAGCPLPQAQWPGDPALERAIRRLEQPTTVPPMLLESSVWTVVRWTLDLEATIASCPHWNRRPPGATYYAIPPVSQCVLAHTTDEILAADVLAAWGYLAAAEVLAEHAARWEATDCPTMRRPGRRVQGALWSRSGRVVAPVEEARREPSRCDCGGQVVQPSPYWFGVPKGGLWHPMEQLQLRGHGGTEPLLDAPASFCPENCVATARTAFGTGEALPAARPLEVQVHSRPWMMWITAPGDRKPPPGGGLAVACEAGAAEWLGAWIPYDSSEGSRCVAEAASSVEMDRWAILVAGSRPRD